MGLYKDIEYFIKCKKQNDHCFQTSIEGNNEIISRIKGDWETFMGQVKYDNDGNKLNPLKLKDVENSDIKTLAAKLQQIDENTNTHGEYFSIGELYGFKLLVKTAQSGKRKKKTEYFER